MRVAIDIDDTITRSPEFFSLLTTSLVNQGHKALIVTFRTDRLEARRLLKDLGVEYTDLITARLEDMIHRDINRWKGEICRRYDVDIFFEDMPEVLQHVDPSTLCFMPVDQGRYDLSTLAKASENQ